MAVGREMSSPAREIEFEEQLKEAGKLLIKPPSELQELCGLLDVMKSFDPFFCCL